MITDIDIPDNKEKDSIVNRHHERVVSFKESESEHGDKTYLVRTDLAGQVNSHTKNPFKMIFHRPKVGPTYGTATMEGSPCSLTRQLELADMAELLYRWLANLLGYHQSSMLIMWGMFSIACTFIQLLLYPHILLHYEMRLILIFLAASLAVCVSPCVW